MDKAVLSPLITATELQQEILTNQQLVIIDARFDLMNTEYGDESYAKSRIPTALRIDLEMDLCSEITPETGRHPLKPAAELEALMQDLGINSDSHIVTYDDSGSIFAIQLWWVLRWLGHKNVQVLEGGIKAWQALSAELEEGEPRMNQNVGTFTIVPSEFGTVDVNAIMQDLTDNTEALCVIDARGAPRYRGEVEPLDPVAGHIPKAINRPFELNLNADGTFKSPNVLKLEWQEFLKNHKDQEIVHQCGSGVSACHNVFSMYYAGLGATKIYPGSWSEWCKSSSRPIEKG